MLYLDGKIPLDVVRESFIDYVMNDEYVHLRNKDSGEHIAVLQSKRGNRAYARKQMERVALLEPKMKGREFDFAPRGSRGIDERYTYGFMFTGNIDPRKFTLEQAWMMFRGYNSLPNRIRSITQRCISSFFGGLVRYGSHSRREAHRSGYPHIHIIFLFDKPLRVKRMHAKRYNEQGKAEYLYDRSGKPIYTWRLKEYNKLVKPIKDAWSRYTDGSFCDIQGIVGGSITDDDKGYNSNVFYYLLKYVIKDINLQNDKSVYTHMFQKLFNMRDIFSRSFLSMFGLKSLARHDAYMHELKQLNRRIRVLERLQGDFSFIPPPLQALYAERDRLIASKPPSKWEYLGTLSFPDDSMAESFFLALSRLNSGIRAEYESLQRDNGEYILSEVGRMNGFDVD